MKDTFVLIENNFQYSYSDSNIRFVTLDFKEAVLEWIWCILQYAMRPWILKELQKKNNPRACLPVYTIESWNGSEKKIEMNLGHSIIQNKHINTVERFLQQQDDIINSVQIWITQLDAGKIPQEFFQFFQIKADTSAKLHELTPTWSDPSIQSAS